MGVIFTHGFTDNSCRFLVGLVMCNAELVHRIQNAALNRLEAISYLRNGPAHYHAHRIFQVRIPDFILNRSLFHNQSAHKSIFDTNLAFSSINLRLGSTLSPISMEKSLSAAAASSMVTSTSFLVAGFIVVSQSCSGFISPRPLNLCTITLPPIFCDSFSLSFSVYT